MTDLAIVCDTSAIQIVLVDEGGDALATGESAYRPDHSLWSEQGPSVRRAAMFAEISHTRAAAPKGFAAQRGIGFSWRMHSSILLSANDKPVCPAMLHDDSHAVAEARELLERYCEIAGVVGVKPIGPRLRTSPSPSWSQPWPPSGCGSRRFIAS